MSQAGKVLQLYVEVRPVAEEDGPAGGGVSDDLASRSQYSSWRCGRTGTAASPSSSRRSISPSSNHEAVGKHAYASQLTADFADRTTPSPSSSPAESHRSESPNTEGTRLAPYASLLGPRSPEQDRRRRAEQTPPLTRPGRISPAPPKSQSPVLDLHRQRAPSPGRNHPWQGSHRGPERSPGNHEWRASGRVQPGDKDRQSTQTQLLDPTGSGASSLSSSGVTGSVGDSSHPSPKTSSQSSQDTSGAGSAMQSDGSAETTPSRSQKIARAKWEFLFGGQREENRCSGDSPSSPSSTNRRKGPDGALHKASHHKVRQIQVELVTSDPCDFAPKTGIIRHTIKYSETDLDAVPLRCYRETDLDEVRTAGGGSAKGTRLQPTLRPGPQVMRAEAEAPEDTNATCRRGHSSLKPGHAHPDAKMDGGREGKEGEEDGGGGEGRRRRREQRVESEGAGRQAETEGRRRGRGRGGVQVSCCTSASPQLRNPNATTPPPLRASEASANAQGGLKSPISLGSPRRPSENHLDSFSRHFESIMESHRAKGTSYSSLDSVDLLTSGSTSVFTFDLPTLTPEIQSQICQSAKQIIELSFAPLTHADPSQTSRSEISLSGPGAGPQSGSKDDSGYPARSLSEKAPWRRSILKDGFRKASSTPSLHG
ncbi:unnamed protein product [Tetraodon nigroviridis]|uniref:(spotted green pufferfish) hypothetical protein n=1 Tax=Tetraodon nigroviridis TaxID=99883 RepID=Q4S2P1_TETNG|nr:unnamed protein product [Tetraodon nigroviridis]